MRETLARFHCTYDNSINLYVTVRVRVTERERERERKIKRESGRERETV